VKKLFLPLTFATLLLSHDLSHRVFEQKSVVVEFSFGAGREDFSYQQYEVFKDGSDIPYMVGRTDKNSRAVFLPDSKGKWIVKAISDDGHGKVVEVDISENMVLKDSSKSLFEKFQKLFVGVAVILALFLLFKQISKRRKK